MSVLLRHSFKNAILSKFLNVANFSFNIETLNSSVNLPKWTSFIKFDAATATFKNLLKMAVLKEHLNETVMER